MLRETTKKSFAYCKYGSSAVQLTHLGKFVLAIGTFYWTTSYLTKRQSEEYSFIIN